MPRDEPNWLSRKVVEVCGHTLLPPYNINREPFYWLSWERHLHSIYAQCQICGSEPCTLADRRGA